MTILTSSQLHPSATVPHCLDDQYMPPEALSLYMQDLNGATIEEDALRAREQAVHREFIRSLLYSPQVVLNRAYAINEAVIRRILADGSDAEAFARILRDRRIVILLFTSKRISDGAPRPETSMADLLDDPPDIGLREEGLACWRKFLDGPGKCDLGYIRPSNTQIDAIAERFRSTLFALTMNPTATLRMLDQCTWQGQEVHGNFEAYPEVRRRFLAFLEHKFVPWAMEAREHMTRRTLYNNFIAPRRADGAVAPIGIRAPSGDSPFPYELKLMADLVYNHNLPHTLGRHSFIPSGLPDPRCLPLAQFQPLAPGSADEVARAARGHAAFNEVLEAQIDAAHHFRYLIQAECKVPDWATVTVADVVEMYGWAEWKAYRAAQDDLTGAVGYERFEKALFAFGESIGAFHARITRDFDRFRHWRAFAGKMFKVVVKVAVRVGVDFILPENVGAAIKAAAGAVLEGGIDVAINFFDDRAQKGDPSASVVMNLHRHVQWNDDTRAKLERLERAYANMPERVATPAILVPPVHASLRT